MWFPVTREVIDAAASFTIQRGLRFLLVRPQAHRRKDWACLTQDLQIIVLFLSWYKFQA